MTAPHNIDSRLQAGQAAVEALVLMLVMAVLWTGIAWLGRIQDMALQASHASRYAAFFAARDDRGHPLEGVRTASMDGRGNQWADRRGNKLRNSIYQDLDVNVFRQDVIPADKQVGGGDARMAQLRKDWLNAEPGILSAQVSLIPRRPTPGQLKKSSLLGLQELDNAFPLIRRHTSILTGSGHASNDMATADRIAGSSLAWSDSAEHSYRLGRRVSSAASKVDAAWRRPDPVFEWLRPWAGDVPSHHLRTKP